MAPFDPEHTERDMVLDLVLKSNTSEQFHIWIWSCQDAVQALWTQVSVQMFRAGVPGYYDLKLH